MPSSSLSALSPFPSLSRSPERREDRDRESGTVEFRSRDPGEREVAEGFVGVDDIICRGFEQGRSEDLVHGQT